METAVLEIFTDGGSRGNPGPAACAFVVVLAGSRIGEGASSLGTLTNNEAEYQGFLLSLAWLKTHINAQTTKSVSWKLDSKLVVEQLNRRWKIKEPRMRLLAQNCWSELATLKLPYTITHVPREQNALADALLNQTLDNVAQ